MTRELEMYNMEFNDRMARRLSATKIVCPTCAKRIQNCIQCNSSSPNDVVSIDRPQPFTQVGADFLTGKEI